MSHGPATEWKKERSEGFKSKLGIIMFLCYTAFYLTFVLLCVLNPKLMANSVGNINLAIAYGFALIIVAIIQAVVYNIICARREHADLKEERETKGKK